MLYRVFLSKLYRSGGGVVLAVPKDVREDLDLGPGDDVVVAIGRIIPAEAKLRSAAYLERAIEVGMRRLEAQGILSPLRNLDEYEDIGGG